MVCAVKFSNRDDGADEASPFSSVPEQPDSPTLSARASAAMIETVTRDITFPRFAAYPSTHAHLCPFTVTTYTSQLCPGMRPYVRWRSWTSGYSLNRSKAPPTQISCGWHKQPRSWGSPRSSGPITT
ncbi:Uncharacterised protein [Mycobacteroides abscessus subsp. abscessus]|nr:Uncharacterised protein [Mycobacteroides abscessus subsp. abscessus]